MPAGRGCSRSAQAYELQNASQVWKRGRGESARLWWPYRGEFEGPQRPGPGRSEPRWMALLGGQKDRKQRMCFVVCACSFFGVFPCRTGSFPWAKAEAWPCGHHDFFSESCR